jgi:hypothetical protein
VIERPRSLTQIAFDLIRYPGAQTVLDKRIDRIEEPIADQ